MYVYILRTKIIMNYEITKGDNGTAKLLFMKHEGTFSEE